MKLSCSGLLALFVITGTSCYSTYAPATRGGISGMPEALGRGSGTIHASYGWPFTHVVEPRLAFGLTRRLNLDLNLLLYGISDSGIWDVMGGSGLFVEILRHKFLRLGASVGFGIGRGGRWSLEEDEEEGIPTLTTAKALEIDQVQGLTELQLRPQAVSGLCQPKRCLDAFA